MEICKSDLRIWVSAIVNDKGGGVAPQGGHFGAILGWGHLWHDFGITLGSLWARFRTILEAPSAKYRNPMWVQGRCKEGAREGARMVRCKKPRGWSGEIIGQPEGRMRYKQKPFTTAMGEAGKTKKAKNPKKKMKKLI